VKKTQQGGDPDGIAMGEPEAVIEADDLVMIAHQVRQVIPFERADYYFAISRNSL